MGLCTRLRYLGWTPKGHGSGRQPLVLWRGGLLRYEYFGGFDETLTTAPWV